MAADDPRVAQQDIYRPIWFVLTVALVPALRDAMGSLSLTASKAIQRRGFGPLLPGVYHAPYPDRYRPPLGTTAESCAAACVDFIEHQLFASLVSPDEVAAIIVEPIQGEGGYIVAPDEFLQRLRELTTKHGILLVADEVQSGMGRSGKMFAIEFTGVEPDGMAIAKGIASGLPLGVAVARAGLMAWPPGAHASTFGGNPVACAAAIGSSEAVSTRFPSESCCWVRAISACCRLMPGRCACWGSIRCASTGG